MGHGEYGAGQRADKRANRMSQEGHEQVPRLQQVHRGPEAFGACHIDARRRRDQCWPKDDEGHVDTAAYGDTENQSQCDSEERHTVSILEA